MDSNGSVIQEVTRIQFPYIFGFPSIPPMATMSCVYFPYKVVCFYGTQMTDNESVKGCKSDKKNNA